MPTRPAGAVRVHEIRASLAALDVTEHHLLGLPDGALAVQPAEAIVRRLARIIDLVAPDTILTYGPDGMTGHEDHQTVSRWVTAAHTRAAPDARLFYAATTDEFADAWEPCRDQFNIFLAPGLPLRTPAADLALSLRLDPAAVDRKIVALRAQASQTTALFAALAEDRVRQWWSTETFVAAATACTQDWGTRRVAARPPATPWIHQPWASGAPGRGDAPPAAVDPRWGAGGGPAGQHGLR